MVRKAGILLIVLIACRLDQMTGTTVVRTAVILFFIANDGFSIVENMGIMGVPMPPIVKNGFELLRQKSESTAQGFLEESKKE
ncbi:MAG: phage holin family protein [Oscillospiraceae bacterium]|nr:phage holin family protein [Oscillospiraceae bacterium]